MVLKPTLLTSILAIVLAAGIGIAAGLVVGTREPQASAIGRAIPPTHSQR